LATIEDNPPNTPPISAFDQNIEQSLIDPHNDDFDARAQEWEILNEQCHAFFGYDQSKVPPLHLWTTEEEKKLHAQLLAFVEKQSDTFSFLAKRWLPREGKECFICFLIHSRSTCCDTGRKYGNRKGL
jgi:hypothetical protein